MNNTKRIWRVVYMEAVPEDTAKIIASRLPIGLDLKFVEDYSDDAALAALSDADFALVATHPMPAYLINSAPKLCMIQHQGVGYDKTDVVAAQKKGIIVAVCPQGTIIGVAEHTFLLILSLYKQILKADASVRKGEWLQFGLRSGSFEIAGKTIGLLGFGRIGQAVAIRGNAFGAKVCYYDIERRSPEEERLLAIEYLPFNKLLNQSDILSLHLSVTPNTKNIINRSTIKKMKKGSIIINTSRGSFIDQAALVEALKTGHIAGAGLDVFEQEPPLINDPLLKMSNVVLTPHIGAGSRDALITKMDACFANMLRIVKKEKPFDVITTS